MISTSAEYQASIAKRTKRKTYAKVEINYTDPFVDQSLTVNDPVLMTEDGYLLETEDDVYLNQERDMTNSTYWDQVADGVYEPSANWFPLDGSGLLDGTFVLMPPGNEPYYEPTLETGWWGYEIAGSGGTFTNPQTLAVTMSPRSVESLLVCSDSIKNEYPVDFTIDLYDTDDNILYTETVTGNTLTYWIIPITAVSAVTSQLLTITKWSHAGRCAKVYEFFTSIMRTYLSGDIFDMELLEERNPDSATLPIGNISSNQFTIKLFNYARQFDYGSGSAIANLVKPKRKILPYIGAEGVGGVIEWIPLGVFWSKEWDVPDDDIYASTVANDILDLMSTTSYTPGLLTNKTIYDIIEAACIDFGLIAGTYWIDPDLDLAIDIIPYAYIDKTTHREAIRVAAEASLASVFSDRYGVLRVEGPDYMRMNSTESIKTIAGNEYFTRKNPSRYSDISNIINVGTSPLVADAAPSSVYQDTALVVPWGQTTVFTISYTAKPVISATASLNSPPSGVSITATTYYPWGADVSIQNTNTIDSTVELNVSATILTVNGASKVTARDLTSISEFGEIVYDYPDNPLVQTRDKALAIADQLLRSYSNARRDVSQTWRGDPAIELSDRITTDTSRMATDYFWIIRQTLSWDGTLQVSHDGLSVPLEYLLMTESGYILETEDSYLLETE